MGFLEDLVKTIQEAADEARAQQKSRKSSSDWAPSPTPDELQRQRASIVRRHREQHQAAERAVERAQQAHEARAARDPESPRPAAQPTGAERLARLLRQPRTVREVMLLREILDQPLALRRLRRGRAR